MQIADYVSPTDESTNVFTCKGLEQWLGNNPQASWALSYVHIKYIDTHLAEAYQERVLTWEDQHDLAVFGCSNLFFRGEVYKGCEANLCLTPPS
jgi:hypothetical protein